MSGSLLTLATSVAEVSKKQTLLVRNVVPLTKGDSYFSYHCLAFCIAKVTSKNTALSKLQVTAAERRGKEWQVF